MIRGRLIFPFVLIFLCLPYILLLRFLPAWQWPEPDEFFWALKNSLLQATGSALLALVTGFFLLPGYLRLPNQFKVFAAWLMLSPSFFPPLFLLLSFFSVLNPFPMGIPGIILIQGFMNAGLLCVLLARVLEEKWSGLLEVSQIFGASRVLFVRAAFKGLLPEVLSLGFFVFAMSFASFSIPFVVGAGKATTLEILIYEKIRLTNDWGSALSLSLIQLALLALFIFLPKTELRVQENRSKDLRFWGSLWGFPFVLLYVLFFWGPLLVGLPKGLAAMQVIPGLFNEVFSQTAISLSLAIAAGGACLCLFLISCFGGPSNGIPRLLRVWLAPSTALLGFAFLFQSGNAMSFYLLALCLIFFPSVYRLGLDRALESLGSQVEVAKTLGASDFLIWRQILLPQIWKTACLLSGVVAIWVLGEFALGKVILGQTMTWALTAESLLSSFRVEAGMGLSALILIAGAFVFSFFWGLAHVRR